MPSRRTGEQRMSCSEEAARHRAEMPPGTRPILDTRSLGSYQRLATLLRPGLAVLDVGCGTGAITRDMAASVAPEGRVLGVDVNIAFIEEARRRHAGVAGLSFEVRDIYRLAFDRIFDLVSAARVLQWLARPRDGVRQLTAAAKPSGKVAILDYNHEKVRWTPDPPASTRAFHEAFLRWRADAGMDNAIADHLAAMFRELGFMDIVTEAAHETTRRGEPDFELRIGIWADVMASRGHQMVQDGVITENDRRLAEGEYRAWMRDTAESQMMYLLSVEGTRR